MGLLEGRNEGLIEGEIKGKIQMCQEFGISKEDTLNRIKNEFEFTDEVVIKYIDKYWEKA